MERENQYGNQSPMKEGPMRVGVLEELLIDQVKTRIKGEKTVNVRKDLQAELKRNN